MTVADFIDLVTAQRSRIFARSTVSLVTQP